MPESKTLKQTFYISDFEEEQEFISSLNNDGWRLTDINGKRYLFEKCDKEVYIYQIDFYPKEQRKDEYIQLFSDFGWKLITEIDGRFYFSKPASQCGEDKIFSDRETITLCAVRI